MNCINAIGDFFGDIEKCLERERQEREFKPRFNENRQNLFQKNYYYFRMCRESSSENEKFTIFNGINRQKES
jgi:hypothetical protein